MAQLDAISILPLMCRVKEGKVSKPSVGPGGGAPPRRRGRPAIDWTWSRKRQLLRLYLCTPEAELSLKKILEILAEGPFQPKPRHTQCLLNDMLSKSYRQKRPKSRATMGERLGYLRSIRERRLQTDPRAVPRREVVDDCAILLKSHPGGRKPNHAQARDTSGEPEEDDGNPSSPLHQRPGPASDASRQSPETGNTRTSLGSEGSGGSEAADAEMPLPALFRNPWSACEDVRHEKVEFLRERCPSSSSSFLADVASLLSGLSIRSGLSRSSSGSSRRSIRSVSSRPEASGSGEERPSTALSMAESLARSADIHTSVASEDMTFPSYAWTRPIAEASYMPASNPHTLENQELVRFCCAQTSWCIHQRITAILMQGSPSEMFACTAAEVNSCDGLGNTALHVAARWGAPGPVLFRIMMLASHLSAANHRGETFLHALDPSSLTPKDLSRLTKHLASKGFDFGQLDGGGQSAILRLMSRPSFSLEALEELFCNLPEADRLALLHPSPKWLVDTILARLLADGEQTAESAAAYCAYFTARYGGSLAPALG